MPLEIVSSNPNIGEIALVGLLKMKNDFIEQADIKPYNGRDRLIKKYSVAINVQEFQDLIDYYNASAKGINVININFAIHLNPAPAVCPGYDYSDSLTIIVEAATFNVSGDSHSGYTSHNDVGDFVVIPAYPTVDKDNMLGSSPCCPSAHP